MGEKVKKLKKWQKIVIVVLAIVLVVVGGFFVFRKQIGDWVLTDEEKVVLHFYNDAQECIKRTGIDAQLYDIVYNEHKKVYKEGLKQKWTQPDGTLVYEMKDYYYYLFQAYYVYNDNKPQDQYDFTYFGEELSYTVDSENNNSKIELTAISAGSSIQDVRVKLYNMNWDFLKKEYNYKVNEDSNSPYYYKYFIRSTDNQNLETKMSDFEKVAFKTETLESGTTTSNYTFKQLRGNDHISLLKIKLFSDYPF